MKTCDRPKIQQEKLMKCNSTAIDTGYQGSNLCLSLEILGHSVLLEGQEPATDNPWSHIRVRGRAPAWATTPEPLSYHHKWWHTGWVTCEQHSHAIHRSPVSNERWRNAMAVIQTPLISGNKSGSVSTWSHLLWTVLGSLNQSATRLFRMTGDSWLLWQLQQAAAEIKL